MISFLRLAPVRPWVAEAISAPVSWGVLPDGDHTLHQYTARHHLEPTLQMNLWSLPGRFLLCLCCDVQAHRF